ncbi:type I restriction endonuclease subunit R [Actinotignum urinale]|uniref:type I restriction endonuclease subunit R n=1 Tax=Actinotignum urinale TaxID=190146 RepID=UPI002A7EC49B|nr:type I restriction endonuclease subunit R [Actinotignum urinale]MDY5128675.1 type I restriction endonuclease subunit R [Actinotignum urinale]
MKENPARHYEPIAVSSEATVATEYESETNQSQAYQSEKELEHEFISQLESQKYEKIVIHNETGLIKNLRTQLEILNDYEFTDSEWDRFFKGSIAKQNDTIGAKSFRIHEDYIQILERDNGLEKNIKLIDHASIHNNRLQVMNQYVAKDDNSPTNRYDVTILLNGLPMVHVELKRRGISIREAFNQIDRYQRDSFGMNSGLFEYVQLFVISNGTLTKYYSNTTRQQHISDNIGKSQGKSKSSHSFEFTSCWADAHNRPITDLLAFTKTFFAKHTLLNIITRYCVLTTDRILMVMRPYQIVATERILTRITTSTNYKKLGKAEAGGYVWHTTGSGKTLTSFKTAQLASRMESVDKVLFVVDRKDLDYQTMREYDKFQKGAANSNTSTAILARQLGDSDSRIIVTTIQKLATFVRKNPSHDVYGKHVVMIFDECHRSQFGDMHKAITKSFKRYNLFGFTGTPIFAENSGSARSAKGTTEQLFGEKLHTYTIVDAINDKNVLPFRIDYINTIQMGNVNDGKVTSIDTEEALLSQDRVKLIVDYTLEHFAQKTLRETGYEHTVMTNVPQAVRKRKRLSPVTQKMRVKGFNALFATQSIEAAKRYYNAFAQAQDDVEPQKRLKIGMIFSQGANPNAEEEYSAENIQGLIGEETFDTDGLAQKDREFLDDVINDYNDMFGTSYSAIGDSFENYYKDLSQRLKNRELDMVIVVNMFLTGFDATTLNTLFVDKNLRMHGLIQAFSRTNRILNSVKTYGNIVCFRNLEKETNEALQLFGNKDAHSVVLMKSFEYYLEEYTRAVEDLRKIAQPGEIPKGEELKKKFIALFGKILTRRNILSSFDEFSAENDPLNPREIQDYQSVYNELYEEFKSSKGKDAQSILDDVEFEIELVKQVEVNVDYILMLVEEHKKKYGNGRNKEIKDTVMRAVDASLTLRDKRDLIEEFINQVNVVDTGLEIACLAEKPASGESNANVPSSDSGTDTATPDITQQWQRFVRAKRENEEEQLIQDESLKPEETKKFMATAFSDGYVDVLGTALDDILPKVSRFSKDGSLSRYEVKKRVVERLQKFHQRYSGLVSETTEE